MKSIDGETQSTVEAWTVQRICEVLTIPDWNKHNVTMSSGTISVGMPVARVTPLRWTCVGHLHALASTKRTAYATFFQTEIMVETRLDEQLRENSKYRRLAVEPERNLSHVNGGKVDTLRRRSLRGYYVVERRISLYSPEAVQRYKEVKTQRSI